MFKLFALESFADALLSLQKNRNLTDQQMMQILEVDAHDFEKIKVGKSVGTLPCRVIFNACRYFSFPPNHLLFWQS